MRCGAALSSVEAVLTQWRRCESGVNETSTKLVISESVACRPTSSKYCGKVTLARMKTILLLLLPATLSFQPRTQKHHAHRLRGAAADFITEAFGATPEDSADAERRIIGASPGPVAQLFSVARAPDETTDADDAALLEARCGEVRAELASRTAGLAALGLSAAEVKRTVGRVPEVLAYSAATTARAAAALKVRLALDDVAFKKKIALRLPQALGLSYDADVAPELDALQAGLDLCDAELRALVLGAPQILGLSYEADVAPSVARLEREFGSPEAARAEVLRKPAALELEVRGSKRGSAA